MFIPLIFLIITIQSVHPYERNVIDPAYVTAQDMSSLSQKRFLNPTTIITDCTPSVCHNLGNLLQLMIVSNLLLTSNINSEAAIKLTSPIVQEVLSSPAFTNMISNPIIQKQIASSQVSPKYIPASPNLVYQDLPLNVNQVYPDYLVQNSPIAPNVVSNFNSISPNLVFQNPITSNVAYPNFESIPTNLFLQNVPLAVNLASPNIESLSPNLIYNNIPVGAEIISASYPNVLPNFMPNRVARRPRSNSPNSKLLSNIRIR